MPTYIRRPTTSLVIWMKGPVARAGLTFSFSSVRGTRVPKTVAKITTQNRDAETAKLGGFESQLAAVTALAFFIPLIGGTGGNVGVQASAIVVQGLANGRLELKEFWNQIWRGLRVAIINAVVISAFLPFKETVLKFAARRNHERVFNEERYSASTPPCPHI